MKIIILALIFTLNFTLYNCNLTQILLDTVKASPAACSIHNETGWLNLFSPDGYAEDPVGTASHQGSNELIAFWNTFIADTDIKFFSHFDIVSEKNFEVVRYVNITATLKYKNNTISTNQPAIILYTLKLVDNIPKISSLQAHWVLLDRIKEQYTQSGGVISMLQMGRNLIKYMGISGVIGYAKGFMGVHYQGKSISELFFSRVNNKDEQWVEHFTESGVLQLIYVDKIVDINGKANIHQFYNDYIKNSQFTVKINSDEFFPSGYKVAGVIKVEANNVDHFSVFIFEFKEELITRARIWSNTKSFK